MAVGKTAATQAKYGPYPAYKSSNTEWLGDIPDGWLTIQIGRLFRRIKRTGFIDSELLSVYRDHGVVPKSSRDDNNNKASEDLTPYQLVKKNDLVLNKMKTWQGSIAVSDFEGIVSPAYFVYQPEDKLFEVADPKYVHFLVRNPMYIAQYLRRSKGIRVSQWDLDPSEFQRIELLLPPIPEQTKIAAFLDHETAKIDGLIAKQQRLIALLEEKRQAVISHAVTKGLDPTAPLRPSGIDWLGDVPAHWEVKHGKHLFEFVTSGSRGWAEYYSDDGALFFRITNLTRDTIRPKLKSLQYVTPPRGSEGERSKIALGDLLISITADLGSVCVADENLEGGYVSQHVALCRPNDEVFSADWFGYTILSDASKFQLLESGYGGTKVQLSLPDLRELIVAKPPEIEQIQIADFLDRKMKQFADILDRSTDQISLLKERRTALISAAVTGKIDLRDWQAPEGTQPHSTQDIDQRQEALA